TSDLARELGQSMPAVSAHLGVLRRAELVTSWRTGRRVLYQRTALATSVVAACGGVPDARAARPAQ
ncbi:MAG: helix-turn-helix domain-containing protein, partial [Actinomycetota bacterium]|nr:helix-turn-helix domain-containing protein [Actinomycetota bacterium]